MINFKIFFEARKNPDVNKRELPMNTLKPYMDEPDYFISMRTSLTNKEGKAADISDRSKHHEPSHKIGINPKSTYNTPNGIYTYRLVDVAYHIEDKGLDALPFMGKAPFVYLLKNKAQDRTLNLKELTEDKVKAIIERVIEHNPNLKMSFMHNMSTDVIKSIETVINMLGQLINKTKVEYFVKNYGNEHMMEVKELIDNYLYAEVKSFLNKSDNIMAMYDHAVDTAFDATFKKSYTTNSSEEELVELTKKFFSLFLQKFKEQYNSLSKSESISTDFIYSKGNKEAERKGYPGGIFWWFVYKLVGGGGGNDPNPNKWNKQLRDIGYDVIIDPGLAIIHLNEPSQTVFLTKQAFEVVKVVGNYKPSGDTKDFKVKKSKYE